mmetsp:Transcript_2145/g.5442  ORF Transcript_2145/g.5442 Transcript_2145/m.5442 type:complete len:221 (+) Transcript_2145:38-700(+)
MSGFVCARASAHTAACSLARASAENERARPRHAHPRRRDVVRGSVSQVAAGSIKDEDKVPDPDSRTTSTRRDFLAAQVIAAVTATQALVPPDAWAAVEAGLDLPEDYFKKARDAVNTLTTSLEFEATNPKDADRFRKAEPAKEAVKAFIKDWASAPAAQGDRAHDDIVLAVRELGEFYKANGSRSRLSPDARESILAKLYDAKEALPPAPPSLADRLLGL